ncbi:MAG TPA: DNA polymerase III subunit delta' C-terminal domain-containing protein, partial [Patescibacteria group bacterium]|nr:DNA polymerase III subunit delta' C-terminal domain-containing protein [Patescibacteria group bacterium]
EEPPANTIFILLVQNHNSLLPTVLSRCQIFYLRKVSTQQIEKYLTEHYNYDKEQITFAAAAANGIIGRAVEILSNKELQEARQNYVSFITKISNASYTELSTIAGDFADSRETAERLLDFMLSWYRDILISKQDCEKQVLVNSDNADVIVRQGEKLDESKLNRIIDAIKRTISYINHNVGTKNSIDSMLLNIMEVYNG